jgi:hypothetical protein
MTEPKKAKREATIGQRVPAEVRTKFNDFAQRKMKCTAAELLRALMEATYSGNAKTDKNELHVHVSVGKGVVGAEVVSKLDEILSRLAGTQLPEPQIPVAALAEEVPKTLDILDQISTPRKHPKVDDRGNIILQVPYEKRDVVKDLGACWEKYIKPGYWFIPKEMIAHVDMEAFEEWLA